MSENKINLKNPLKSLAFKTEDIVNQGEFGAVMARAGIGKTSFVVQLAIYAMARGKKVLHLSLDEPVKKINLWYGEVFTNIAEKNNIDMVNQNWESILPNRLIMTLKLDGFSVPRLEERMGDLIEQNIFTPEMVVIDGFPFKNADRSILEELKKLAEKMNLNIWFTVTTHRHEQPDADGIPVQLASTSDLFSTAIQILPEDDKINLKVVKGDSDSSQPHMIHIDTATMLISE